MSREHVLSAAVIAGPTLTVQGFPWCIDEARTIPGGLASRILCKHHNSVLSPLDAAGQSISRAFSQAARLSSVRDRIRRRRPWVRVERFPVDGPLFERWLMKTAINATCLSGEGTSWYLSGTPYGEPPKELVEWIYGGAPPAPQMGLYAARPRPQAQLEIADSIGMAPTLALGKRIVGFVFEFWGFPFFLSLVQDKVPSDASALKVKSPLWEGAQLAKHPSGIEFDSGRYRSHVIEFRW